MSKNAYEVLGLEPGASLDEVRKAYRKIAKKSHPDVNKKKGTDKKFIEATNAYKSLCDELKDNEGQEFVPSGRWTIRELEEKLMEFYDRHGLDSTVRIDNRRQAFQMDGIEYWMSKGYMKEAGCFDEDSVLGHGMGQYKAFFYGLTKKGKAYVKSKKQDRPVAEIENS